MRMLRQIFSLAWNSFTDRKTTIVLSVLTLTIAVIMFVFVEKLRYGAENTFDAAIGQTDLIVAARSDDLPILLATIFQAGHLRHGISYKTFEEIRAMKNIKWAIPLSYGDSYKGYRVVGTDLNYFQHWQGADKKPLTFLRGAPLEDLWQAVIGYDVAQKLKLNVGDKVVLNHGISHDSVIDHGDLSFTVGGILNKSFDATDKSIFIKLQAVAAIHHDWQDGLPGEEHHSHEHLQSIADQDQLKLDKISALYIRLHSKNQILRTQRSINDFEKEPLTAVVPGITLPKLWGILAVVKNSLFYISIALLSAGFLSMLTMFFAHLKQRQKEIAILRAIGAKRRHIIGIFLCESLVISICALLLGYLLSISSLVVATEVFGVELPVYISFMQFSTIEFIFSISIITGALLLALVPAVLAYRNSVHEGLLH